MKVSCQVHCGFYFAEHTYRLGNGWGVYYFCYSELRATFILLPFTEKPCVSMVFAFSAK